MIDKIINTFNANRTASYGIIAALMLVTTSATIFLNKSKNKYQEQEEIDDSWYNTTPKLRDRERIIVIYRDGQLVKETQQLDSKGKVLSSKREISNLEGRVKRKGEILRSGDQVEDGDVVENKIIKRDGKYYRVKKILRNGQIVEEETLLNADEVEEFALSEFLEGEKVLSETKDKREKIFINEKGEIKKIIQYLDENGNVIEEHIQDLDEVTEGEIIDEQLITDENGNRKIIRKIIRNGKVIVEEEDLSGEKTTKKKLNPSSLFKINNPNNKDYKEEQEYLNKWRDDRISSGEIQTNQGEIWKKSQIRNRDKNYSIHKEPATIATYPVDLTRVITINKAISAVLYTEIKSHLASRTVTATVEQDIVGSHGRKVLIPAGSSIIGSYTPLSEIGSERIGVTWRRIITPRGINIKLEAEISDAQGAAGVTGEIDRRFKDKYGEALLFSAINAMSQFAVPIDNVRARAAVDVTTREITNVTTELLRKSLSITPRVRIPAGSRITIRSLVDIWFKPPEGKSAIAKKFKKQ
jgi:type IV secretory pathway VirB10-like protein